MYEKGSVSNQVWQSQILVVVSFGLIAVLTLVLNQDIATAQKQRFSLITKVLEQLNIVQLKLVQSIFQKMNLGKQLSNTFVVQLQQRIDDKIDEIGSPEEHDSEIFDFLEESNTFCIQLLRKVCKEETRKTPSIKKSLQTVMQVLQNPLSVDMTQAKEVLQYEIRQI